MRSVTYSMAVSLDGFITGPDGGIDWTTPDDEIFRLVTDEMRGVGVHFMGRRLYEAMLFWETADEETDFDPGLREWARLWNVLPKVVFSSTLTEVVGDHTRLATGSVAEEIERWRAEPGDGEIAVGGAGLAAQVAGLGLIDEYRARVCPVLLGGGTPYFARDERRVELERVESRPLASGIVYLRHRVKR
ncbi:dihydrofolate reductase family protein [Streptomyces sp. NPDC090025]|uniref:dihydrofolate reductase family protein n=1 Tax=Streptomyces sp. NPDC090025 TaxID=3365922 RepID=UPI003832383D